MIADDGMLRMYLRGRAVSLYAPSTLGDYDITKLGQAPKESLKLEWVYPFYYQFNIICMPLVLQLNVMPF